MSFWGVCPCTLRCDNEVAWNKECVSRIFATDFGCRRTARFRLARQQHQLRDRCRLCNHCHRFSRWNAVTARTSNTSTLGPTWSRLVQRIWFGFRSFLHGRCRRWRTSLPIHWALSRYEYRPSTPYRFVWEHLHVLVTDANAQTSKPLLLLARLHLRCSTILL